MLLNIVYVAYSDGQFHSTEAKMIDRLAILLNILHLIINGLKWLLRRNTEKFQTGE